MARCASERTRQRSSPRAVEYRARPGWRPTASVAAAAAPAPAPAINNNNNNDTTTTNNNNNSSSNSDDDDDDDDNNNNNNNINYDHNSNSNGNNSNNNSKAAGKQFYNNTCATTTTTTSTTVACNGEQAPARREFGPARMGNCQCTKGGRGVARVRTLYRVRARACVGEEAGQGHGLLTRLCARRGWFLLECDIHVYKFFNQSVNRCPARWGWRMPV